MRVSLRFCCNKRGKGDFVGRVGLTEKGWENFSFQASKVVNVLVFRAKFGIFSWVFY